jgi:translocation and assembly module TamB
VRALLALAVLLAVLAAALHWASRSDAVLRWAVAQVAQRVPGTLTVTGLRGALTEPVHADAIEYAQEGFTLRVRGVDLEWSPSVLALGRRLWIHALRAHSIEIEMQSSGQAAGLPDGLGLALPVSIDRLQVERLRVLQTGSVLEFTQLDLRYAGDAHYHSLQLAQLLTPWGSLSGDAKLQAQRPFALSGNAVLQSTTWKDWPFRAQAALGGTLAAIATQGSVQLRDLPVVEAQARLTPFAPVPLQRVQAHMQGLDIRAFAPRAPQTSLAIQLDARGAPAGGFTGRVQAANAASGPLDRERLPIDTLAATFDADAGRLSLREAQLDLPGAGRAAGSATLTRAAMETRLTVAHLDLRALHGALRTTALDGTVAVTRTDAGEQIELDLAQARMRVQARATHAGDQLDVHALTARIAEATVEGQGRVALVGTRAFEARARFSALDPAALGDFPAARLTGRTQLRGQLSPAWLAQVDYVLERSQWRGQPLSGDGKLTLSAGRIRDVDARLALAANRLVLRGGFGAAGDRLQFDLQGGALCAFSPQLTGALDARGSIAGSLERPALDGTLEGRGLGIPGYQAQRISAKARLEQGEDPRIAVAAQAQGLILAGTSVASAQLEVEGVRSAHRITLQARRGPLDLAATLEGGLAPPLDRWSGRVLTFETRGSEPLRLVAPAPLSLARGRVAFGPAEVAGAHGRLRIEDSVVADGRIASSGAFSALRVKRLLEALDIQAPVETDLVLGGRWNLVAEREMNGRVEVFREGGDVTAVLDEERFALGLDRLAVDVRVESNRVTATASAAARQLVLSATLQTRVDQRNGRWGLPGTAPLVAEARVQADSIKPLAALVTRAAQVDGRIAATVAVKGTVGDPRLTGDVQGTGLSVEQVSNGLYLTDGTLTAQFDQRLIRMHALTFRGGEGSLTAHGDYDMQAVALKIEWSADRLTAVQRPDLLLVASGSGAAAVTEKRAQVRGKLRMERGRVELREAATRSLGDDVVVVGRKAPSPLPERVLKSQVDVTLELGDDFRVTGRGLDARVVGQVRLVSPGDAPLRADGQIKVAKGTFEVYGRKLDIDPGALYFAGPLDNPALDIRAMRKNQAVEAGVEITGSARKMEVRLVSVPEVPDNEKLAWLTLGRKLDTTNQSEAEAMQRYGAALAATIGTGSFQSKVARAVGLDEISVLPSTDASGAGGVVQLGKRVGDRIYVILEQRLATAENIFKINYQLTRDWSVRLESGKTDAVDLFYTMSFD